MSWSLWLIAAMSGLAAFLFGHQGSYLFAGIPRSARSAFRINLREGASRTNTSLPLFATMWLYHWFGFLPWAFFVWYGYETTWWRALAGVVIGFLFRLGITALTMAIGLHKNAWIFGLAGIPLIPILLGAMVTLTLVRP